MRSRVIRASLALPFQVRQRRRSTSAAIAALPAPGPARRPASRRRLLRVLEPHGEMEPVQDRRVRDAGLGQDGPHAGAAVGERGQLGVAGAAHGVEGAPDQRHDVGAGVRDGAEQLPAAGLVSALPTRTSRCRSPSWQLRMNVESKLRVIAGAAAASAASGSTVAASRSRSPSSRV